MESDDQMDSSSLEITALEDLTPLPSSRKPNRMRLLMTSVKHALTLTRKDNISNILPRRRNSEESGIMRHKEGNNSSRSLNFNRFKPYSKRRASIDSMLQQPNAQAMFIEDSTPYEKDEMGSSNSLPLIVPTKKPHSPSKTFFGTESDEEEILLETDLDIIPTIKVEEEEEVTKQPFEPILNDSLLLLGSKTTTNNNTETVLDPDVEMLETQNNILDDNIIINTDDIKSEDLTFIEDKSLLNPNFKSNETSDCSNDPMGAYPMSEVSRNNTLRSKLSIISDLSLKPITPPSPPEKVDRTLLHTTQPLISKTVFQEQSITKDSSSVSYWKILPPVPYKMICLGISCYFLGWLRYQIYWLGLLLSFLSYIVVTLETTPEAFSEPDTPYTPTSKISDIKESNDWFNEVLNNLWPQVHGMNCTPLLDLLQERLNKEKPEFLKTDILVSEWEWGSSAPEFTSISVLPTNSNNCVIIQGNFNILSSKSTPPRLSLNIEIGEVVIPIQVDLIEISGKLECQFNSLTWRDQLQLSFLQLPEYTVAIYGNESIDVKNISFLSDHIKTIIGEIIKETIYPQFIPFKLSQDNDIQSAIGVLKVTLNEAIDLPTHNSDSFITLQFDNDSPVASSRLIDSNHGKFNETHFLVIPKSVQYLSIKTWCSNNEEQDELVEEIKVPCINLKESKQLYQVTTDCKTKLNCSVDFAAKISPQHIHNVSSVMLTCIIHQAKNLQILPGSSQPLLNPYVTMLINHTVSTITPHKNNTSIPVWHHNGNYFIRDWHTAIITFIVRSYQPHEEHNVLGIASLTLKDLTRHWDNQTSLHCSQWIPISDGIGSGSIHIQLQLNPVELTLPKPLLGYQLGTLVIESIKLTDPYTNPNLFIHGQLQYTPHHPQTTSLHHQTWDNQPLIFPVQNRYQNQLILSLKQLNSDSILETVTIPLDTLIDNEFDTFQIKDFHIELGFFSGHSIAYPPTYPNVVPPALFHPSQPLWYNSSSSPSILLSHPQSLLFSPSQSMFILPSPVLSPNLSSSALPIHKSSSPPQAAFNKEPNKPVTKFTKLGQRWAGLTSRTR